MGTSASLQAAASSSIGSIVPISVFAWMIETTAAPLASSA
jgi:hypothetical protein